MNRQENSHVAGSNCNNPALYVGTYGKYNNGSIQGAWVDLTTFADGNEFLKWCATELHKDEPDPELMFQDYENFPEFLYNESMGSDGINEILDWWKEECESREEEAKEGIELVDYNEGVSVAITGDTYPIRKTLKKMGGKFVSNGKVGPCWVFSAKRREELEKFVTNGGKKSSKEKSEPIDKPDKALLEEYLMEMRKVYPDSESMIEYHRKEASRVIRLTNGGLMVFSKPRMETSFCFGYGCQGMTPKEASDMAVHARTEEYFMQENLRGFDAEIKAYSGEDSDDYRYDYNYTDPYLYRQSYCSQKEPLNVWEVAWMRQYDAENSNGRYPDIQKLNEDDRKLVLEALKAEKSVFEKRLKAWWKRYGASKLKTWTYWADE